MERRVLIVDGIDLARRFVKQSIEKNFSNVIIEEACELKDAQKLLAAKSFDLIICDSDIQPSGGKSLLDRVRKDFTFEKTSFIMIVPAKDDARINTLVQQGASGIIAKPFTATELIERITSHISILDRRLYRRWTTEGSVHIHGAMEDVECRLIDLSLGGVLILVRRDSGLSILDEMSFDLYLEGSSTLENVKGLVIRIQALTPDPESQYAKYALKFIDMPSNLEARLLEHLKKRYPYEW